MQQRSSAPAPGPHYQPPGHVLADSRPNAAASGGPGQPLRTMSQGFATARPPQPAAVPVSSAVVPTAAGGSSCAQAIAGAAWANAEPVVGGEFDRAQPWTQELQMAHENYFRCKRFRGCQEQVLCPRQPHF
jgi:hypothetical protein